MKIQYIGDVHLGKKFEHGVPLHRRGDRERLVFDKFRSQLMSDTSPVVQVGDLFDKPVVPNSVVYHTAEALKEAVRQRPVALLIGNHDRSRDSSRVSSFQILTELVRPYGVVVADEEPISFHGDVLIPWTPWMTAEAMVNHHASLITGHKTAWGHYDVVMGNDNQAPTAALASLGIERLYTGHDHTPRVLKMDGVEVVVTGSIEPFSHGEDPEGRLYVTLRPSELEAAGDLTNKCVRILLEPGEEFMEQVDCLQLTRTRAKVEDEGGVETVEFEAFDFYALLDRACEETGLTIKDQLVRKFEEERAKSG